MKIALCLCVCTAVLTINAGCATQHGVKVAREARKAYEAFVGQRRTYDVLVLRGTDVRIEISGISELALQGQLTPLAAMLQSNDTPGRIVDAMKNTILGVAGLLTLKEIATQPPTIVTQPEPLVVRPEVVKPEMLLSAP